MTDKTILVVDDTEANVDILVDLLSEYDVVVALNGKRAIDIALNESVDIILLDIMMPEMDGYEVCRILKTYQKTKDIPIIFLTAKIGVEDEMAGLELGAVDYITKPFSPPIVKERIKNHLLLKEAKDYLKDKNEYLENEIKKRTEEIVAIQNAAISIMTSLAETRDNDTGNHIVRTSHYVHILAKHLSKNPKFSAQLTESSIELITKSAPLHDVGKIGIPDHILLKKGKLSDEEFKIMKTHVEIGYKAILSAEKNIGKVGSSFLSFAKQITLHHHEKYNGTGYPHALKGDEIPLSARIMALADVYDALISTRVYKKSIPHKDAVEMIKRERSSHFDPDITDAFSALEEEFEKVAQQYAN